MRHTPVKLVRRVLKMEQTIITNHLDMNNCYMRVSKQKSTNSFDNEDIQMKLGKSHYIIEHNRL